MTPLNKLFALSALGFIIAACSGGDLYHDSRLVGTWHFDQTTRDGRLKSNGAYLFRADGTWDQYFTFNPFITQTFKPEAQSAPPNLLWRTSARKVKSECGDVVLTLYYRDASVPPIQLNITFTSDDSVKYTESSVVGSLERMSK